MTVRYVTRAHAQKACRTVLGLSPSLACERLPPERSDMARIADSQPSGPTDAKQISAFEKYIGHRLPGEYREFLLTHNGGRAVPDAFLLSIDDGEPQEDLVMCFFPLRDIALGEVEVEDLNELRTWPLH